jgi:glutaredoxin 3
MSKSPEISVENWVIYSKSDCKYCVLAKKILNEYGITYTEKVVGTDLTRDEFFMIMGPNVLTVPQILIDGRRIGGYEALVEHFKQPPQSTCFP